MASFSVLYCVKSRVFLTKVAWFVFKSSEQWRFLWKGILRFFWSRFLIFELFALQISAKSLTKALSARTTVRRLDTILSTIYRPRSESSEDVVIRESHATLCSASSSKTDFKRPHVTAPIEWQAWPTQFWWHYYLFLSPFILSRGKLLWRRRYFFAYWHVFCQL